MPEHERKSRILVRGGAMDCSDEIVIRPSAKQFARGVPAI